MTLKAVLDSDQFGELDESARSFYTESDDGNYVLDVDGVDDLPSVQGLRNGLKHAKKERGDAKKQLDSISSRFGPLLEIEDLDLSDVDPERIESLRPYLTGEAEIPTGDGKDGDRKTPEELERIRANARKPLERDLQKHQEQAQFWQNMAQTEMVNNTLSAEFARAGVKDPDFLELLIDRYRSRCQIEVDDGKPSIIVKDTEYGDVSPKEFVKEWSGTDYARKFIDAGGNSGGGASGSGKGGDRVKNPWSKEHWNMTEQARIFREDSARAQKMAAEHGKTVGA